MEENASQYPDNLIPTLEQYIACCNKYSVTPVIEIKSIRTEEAMNLFMQLLTESQKEPVLICFRIETLGKLREMGFTGKNAVDPYSAHECFYDTAV